MTNEYILQLASRANYAHVCIDRTCTIGNGQESWEMQLPQLTGTQRAALIAKLRRWEAMICREKAEQITVEMVVNYKEAL